MPQGANQRFGDGDNLVQGWFLIENGDKFIAPKPGERTMPGNERRQAPRHREEQLIAGGMADAIVDDLEAIEIEIQQRDLCLPRTGQQRGQPLQAPAPVRQSRQRIGIREVMQFLFCRLIGRDVRLHPLPQRADPSRWR